MAITGRPPSDERIAAVRLRANEIVLVTAADDPLTRRARVTRQDLEGRHVAAARGGLWHARAQRAVPRRPAQAPHTLTLGSNGAIKQAARVGLGVSLLSRDAVGAELASGALATLPVEGLPAPRPWYAVRSTVGPTRRLVADFLTFLAAELPTDG